MTTTYGSVCSGIEAATVAWRQQGWEAAWLAEIEPFPCAVLAHHYPTVPNLGDMTTIADRVLSGETEAPDVFTGGTPCQAFSVAGLRKGLDDDRGQLSLEFCRIAGAIDTVRSAAGLPPSVIMWENVPGVLSDKDNAFGCFLAGLAGEDDPLIPPGGKWTNAGCVFGPARTVAWRILDAKHFRVAQRRRRVWVVASARDGADPCEILFEREGVRRDSAPSRKTGEKTSGFTASSFGGHREGCGTVRANGGDLGGGSETLVAEGFRMVAFGEYADDDTASAMKARDYKDATDLVAFHAEAQVDQLPTASRDTGISDSLTASQHAAVATVLMDQGGSVMSIERDMVGTLRRETHGHEPVVHVPPMQVRRLTPTECERLQGFPDGYTKIPWKNKPAADCPDGPRYKALGNSWAVPCAAWIGKRIDERIN